MRSYREGDPWYVAHATAPWDGVFHNTFISGEALRAAMLATDMDESAVAHWYIELYVSLVRMGK